MPLLSQKMHGKCKEAINLFDKSLSQGAGETEYSKFAFQLQPTMFFRCYFLTSMHVLEFEGLMIYAF